MRENGESNEDVPCCVRVAPDVEFAGIFGFRESSLRSVNIPSQISREEGGRTYFPEPATDEQQQSFEKVVRYPDIPETHRTPESPCMCNRRKSR